MRLARKIPANDADARDEAPRAKALPLSVHPRSVAGGALGDRFRVRSLRPAQAHSEQVRVAAAFDRICTAMGVSNRQLARRLKVSEIRVRQYRLGERPIPSDVWVRVGRTLAEAFLNQLLARVRGERAP